MTVGWDEVYDSGTGIAGADILIDGVSVRHLTAAPRT